MSPGDNAVKSEQKDDDLRDRIDQLVGAGVLHLHAVQPRGEREPAGIGNFVGGDEPRSKRTGAGPVLARGDGEFLIVAHRAVDEDRIAGDVVECALGRDVSAGFADDERQLALIVEIVGQFRPDHGAAVANERVGKADEHAWLFRQLARHFGRVRAIIDAGAENFVRLRNNGEELDVGELSIGRSAVRRPAQSLDAVRCERSSEARPPHFGVQRDDAVAADCSEQIFAVRAETQKPHGNAPRSLAAAAKHGPPR